MRLDEVYTVVYKMEPWLQKFSGEIFTKTDAEQKIINEPEGIYQVITVAEWIEESKEHVKTQAQDEIPSLWFNKGQYE